VDDARSPWLEHATKAGVEPPEVELGFPAEILAVPDVLWFRRVRKQARERRREHGEIYAGRRHHLEHVGDAVAMMNGVLLLVT
jgi:hypothetical protein